jgi:hypothetical protein
MLLTYSLLQSVCSAQTAAMTSLHTVSRQSIKSARVYAQLTPTSTNAFHEAMARLHDTLCQCATATATCPYFHDLYATYALQQLYAVRSCRSSVRASTICALARSCCSCCVASRQRLKARDSCRWLMCATAVCPPKNNAQQHCNRQRQQKARKEAVCSDLPHSCTLCEGSQHQVSTHSRFASTSGKVIKAHAAGAQS